MDVERIVLGCLVPESPGLHIERKLAQRDGKREVGCVLLDNERSHIFLLMVALQPSTYVPAAVVDAVILEAAGSS